MALLASHGGDEMANAARVTCAGSVSRVRAEAMNIVACVLHELRIPITAILSAGENIRDGLLKDGESLREEGTLIIAEAMRLKNLGDQILLYASTGNAQPRCDMRALTVGEIIDNAVDSSFILLQQGKFTLERRIHPGLPSLCGDLEMLSRCLRNLIANAVKYSGQSRWVGVSALFGQSSIADEDEIHISVLDHGLGISEEDLPHVFEPFYRSRRPAVSTIHGSGMGLSIAKDCAEACGGTLSVVSEEGAGCIFTLRLPVCRELAMKPADREVGAGANELQPSLDFHAGRSSSPYQDRTS